MHQAGCLQSMHGWRCCSSQLQLLLAAAAQQLLLQAQQQGMNGISALLLL
jgi:hypothetical protein